MVYVHDANYYYDGDWSNSPTPTEPPMFVFDDPVPVPIANIGYEYQTGMKDTVINLNKTRATPYLNSIPFHLQDNRTKLEFDSFMYKVESATGGGTQTINFTKISTYQNFDNQVGGINVQNDFSKNPNMSPGMAVYKVGATNSPSDRTLVGYVNALVFINGQPATQSFYFTPTPTPSEPLYFVDDEPVIEPQINRLVYSKEWLETQKQKTNNPMSQHQGVGEDYLTSLDFRNNGKYDRLPNYVILKDGTIVEKLVPNESSNF